MTKGGRAHCMADLRLRLARWEAHVTLALCFKSQALPCIAR